MSNESLNAAKTEKLLDKLYDIYGHPVMTLREFFTKNPPLCKKIYHREYSAKRVHLAYQELKNVKIEYAIFYDERHCITVPKLVYDYYNCPEKL